MSVWLSYLIDLMADYTPVCNFDVSEASSPKVTAVCPFQREMKRLRAGTLYLCLNDTELGERDVPEDAYFIVPAGVTLHNAISLESPPDQDTLYDLLADGMERYRDWHDELMDLALCSADPQRLLDVASALLANPVLVLSSAFALIAKSPDATPQDFPFFDFDDTNRPVPEFLFSMRLNALSTRYYQLGSNDRYSISCYESGSIEVYYNICDEYKTPKVYIVSTIRSKKLTQGYLDLLLDLCTCFKKALDISQFTPLPSTLSAYALEQLLLYGKPSALMQLLQAKPDHRFVFGMYADVQKPRRNNLYAMLRVQDVLPHSIAFLDNDHICFVACVSDKPSDLIYYTSQYQRISAFAAASGGIVGVSNRLRLLDYAKDGLRQAQQALACSPLCISGGSEPVSGNLRFYSDISVYDMLEVFMNGKQSECYVPQEISAIYQADRRAGENNCEILLYYLLTGKSLAAVSDAFHMHRNTVAYRVKRMKELFGVQLDRPDKNIVYLMACLICILDKKSSSASPAPLDRPEKAEE